MLFFLPLGRVARIANSRRVHFFCKEFVDTKLSLLNINNNNNNNTDNIDNNNNDDDNNDNKK